MGGNREISQPSDKTKTPPISQHSEKRRIDFAITYNLGRKGKEHTIQPESSKYHSTSKLPLSELKINISTKSSEICSTNEQEPEKLDDQQFYSWISAYGYQGLCHDLEKECNIIKEKITILKEEYNASNKECESLETKINGLNSKIAAKEQKQKELLSQLNKSIIEQEKTQKEYNSLREEIGAQEDSQSKNLKNLRNQIRNMHKAQIELKKDLKTHEEEIANKKKEKETFKTALEKVKAKVKTLEQYSQEMIYKERYRVELQKKRKIAEQSILDNKEWINRLKELNRESLSPKDNLDYNNQFLKILDKEVKNQKESLNDITKDINKKTSYLNETKRKIEEMEEEERSIPYYKRIITSIFSSNQDFQSKKDHLAKECNMLNDEIESLSNLHEFLSKFTEYYNNEVNDRISTTTREILIFEHRIENINQEITITENCLKKNQEKKDDYNQILKEKDSNTENHSTNSKNGLDISKNDDLTIFREQLRVIKKYEKNNDTKGIIKYIAFLENQNKELQDTETEIEKLEEANRRDKQDIAQYQFEHELYLKEREATTLDYKLDNENFQPSKNADSYKGQNLESLQTVRKRNIELISKLESKLSIKEKNTNNIINCAYEVFDQLENLRKNICKDISRDDYNRRLDEYNSQLTEYINNNNKYKKELSNSGRELLQIKDEIARHELDILTIDKIISDYQLKEIGLLKESYRSKSLSYQTMKSDLQTKIDAELTKITPQLEADLQNLQKSCDWKKSKLESLTSKLVAPEKSMQQETKRQPLLKEQLKVLASQVSTTRCKREAIVQELEGYRKQLEESHKALAAAEQEKRQWGTKIKQSEKELEEKEEQLKHAENEHRKIEYIFKNAYDSLEEAIIEKGQQESDLVKAEGEKKVLEEEYEKAQKRVKNPKDLMKNQLQLHEKDPFTADGPARKALVQAQEEFKKAQTQLLNAQKEAKKAWTQLLNAQTDMSDAVIIKATPDDEDSIRMIGAKRAAMQRQDWRPPGTKRSWDEAAEEE